MRKVDLTPFLLAILLLALALPAAAGEEKRLSEADGLAECFERADRRLDAGLAKRESDLSERIAEQLGACLRARGVDLGDLFSKACYDETLWARMLFGSRQRGVALERLLEGYRRGGTFAPPPGLAEAVYRTEQGEDQFRRELFLDCLAR